MENRRYKNFRQRVPETEVTYLHRFVLKHFRRGLGLAMDYTDDLAVAKALLIDSFVRVARQVNFSKNQTPASEWFYLLLLKRCHRRTHRFRLWQRLKRRLRPAQIEDGLQTLPDATGEGATGNLQNELFKLVRNLPKWQRAAFVLRFYQTFSLQEIAKILNRSPAQVRRLLFAAIERIRLGNV